MLNKLESLQKNYNEINIKKDMSENENKILSHRHDDHKNMINILELELEKEKSLKFEESKLSHSLRMRETELLERESSLKRVNDNLDFRNEDLQKTLKKVEHDYFKANEEVFLRGKDLDSLKSQLTVCD